MFRKIALGTALVIGSVSGAFAWNNIGEIDSRQTSVQAPVAHDAFAAARHATNPALQMNKTFDRPTDVSNY